MRTRESNTYKAYAWPGGRETQLDILYPEMADLMLRRGWGLSRLAEESGTTPHTLRAILSGFTVNRGKKMPYTPKQEKLESISKKLGIPVEVLFKRPESKAV